MRYPLQPEPPARVQRWRVWFSPYLLAVALVPAFVQIDYSACAYYGNSRLSELELRVGGENRLVGFDPNLRSYEASLPFTSEVRVRTVAQDPEASVSIFVLPEEESLTVYGERATYMNVGVGGSDYVVPLPPGSAALQVWVAPRGGATDYYEVKIQVSDLCEGWAAEALRMCVRALNQTRRGCYIDRGMPCASQDPAILAGLDALESTVRGACTDEDTSLSTDALVSRLQTACASETQSLASRTFGGPHGAVWARVTREVAADCLERPHRTIAELMSTVLVVRNECLSSDTCNAAAVETNERALAEAAAAEIGATCESLALVIAIDPEAYVHRALAQLDCLTAVAHDDVDPLILSCGPGVVERDPPPPPEVSGYTKVVLDSEVYGTRCGGDEPHFDRDNPYAFYIKLAPEGYPPENVLIELEGGGACIFDAEEPLLGHAGCYTRYLEDPTLFEATTTPDTMGIGIMSDDPSVSPFANWTKVFLQYCTQDLHMGDGVTNYFENFDFTVHRYGAINLRAALGYVRDLLWKTLDEQGGEGYRPDRITAAFAGFSAGGIGALYNYHWVLDDLQWPHTAAFPDSALVLENTQNDFWNYRTLSNLVLSHSSPHGWGAQASQPPYCFGPDCTILPNLLKAHAPRLKAVPEQQYMLISNQNDEVIMRSTFFDRDTSYEQGRVNFINAGRDAYCETKDLDAINWYFMPFPEALHSTSLNPYFLTTVSVGNQTMMSWMGDVFSRPERTASRVEEGGLVYTYSGVNWFPCALPPPFDPCEGVDCNDENPCTTDTCNSFDGSCRNTPVYDGAYCDFGTLPGRCESGTCEEDLCAGVSCDDQNECTIDRCLQEDGSCSFQNRPDGAYCDFGGIPGLCEGGICEEDLCANVSCNDQNECTIGQCVPEDGSCSFVNRPDGTLCSDSYGSCSDGVCVLFPVCGAGRTLPETALTDERLLICSARDVAFPLLVPVKLAVTPSFEVQLGSNEFEIQAQFGVDPATVNDAWDAGVRVARIESAVASVAPTLGSTQPTPSTMQESPVPCVIQLEQDKAAALALPATQATWTLDAGSTLELTLVDLEETLEAIGIVVELSTSGARPNCSWQTGPPSVQVVAP